MTIRNLIHIPDKVRIDGHVEKLDQNATSDIWRSFPRAAQLTHSASKQDEVLADKKVVYGISSLLPIYCLWCN